ncbi:hypothetical protein [Agrobacterium sp. B1(2019)]|uniref:hypothetical protein n=1 Tax=Agrobacterium sp. B1(2019) TaxID=2607032 RepID=UPI0011EC3E72|nr:hypothetical protein [Agrobacterium sp. B1(2019)]TZG36617.1 hypothetical protein AGR1_03725 [Agrobacterium sp. B1(2019)]
MIKEVIMSPAMALYHWRVNRMSIRNVLSQTGFRSIGELYEAYHEELESTEMSMQDHMMTPEDHQREEDVDAVWLEFGDYLREMVPPAEYDDEIERLLPLVIATRQIEASARSRPFRDDVKRRKAQALH